MTTLAKYIILVTALLGLSNAQLYLLPSGHEEIANLEKKLLSDSKETIVCPKDFANGFTLRCDGPPSATKATFYVNGEKEHTEFLPAYFIAGNAKGIAYKWTPPENYATVECQLETRPKMTYKANLKFQCPATSSDGGDDQAEPEPTPSSTCAADSCPTKEDSDSSTIKARDDNCVVIDTKAFHGSLGDGWSEVDGGIVFKANDNSQGIIPGGQSKVNFKFKVNKYSQYALVLQTVSKGWTEHNDVFVRFPSGGFNLMKFSRVASKKDGNQWVKVYQNDNGWSTDTNTIDYNAHSLSTQNSLNKNTVYDIVLSGRSTMFTIQKIILFPCTGSECQQQSDHWKSSLATCRDK